MLRYSRTVSDNYQTFYIRFKFFPVSEGVFCQFSKTQILLSEPCPALVHVVRSAVSHWLLPIIRSIGILGFFSLSLLHEHNISLDTMLLAKN